MLTVHRLFGGGKGLVEILIERAEHAHPVLCALLDIIELRLHLRREVGVHDVGEMLLHHLRGDLAEGSRLELLAVTLHIHSR